MCGIAGVYSYTRNAAPVQRDELRRVRDHMQARGPDGAGEWFSEDGRAGLAHRRLAIIDTSERGAQPMRSADGKLVISFNGEIYNYQQLRATLEAQGRVFVTDSDTEVLLHLYAVKGMGMLNDLRGMFAFALWDGERRVLLLARDPFGIKPLYYADGQGTLRFASQVKALLCADVDTAPEPAGHVGFMLWGSVPEPWTMYRGIRSLPAGHWLSVDERGVRISVSYCDIGAVLADAATAPVSMDRLSAIESIAAAIRDSVKTHQIADVPVGVFLSAGIDSSVIAHCAADQGQRPFTLTLGFEEYSGTIDDEVPLAEELAREIDAWHSTLITRRNDFEDEREKLLAAMDQPSIDGVNTWFIARAAARMNLKAVLSGLGGDELFASYPSFKQVPRMVRYGRPFRSMPALGRMLRRFSAPLLARITSPKFAGLLEYSDSAGSAYLLRRCLHAPWELPALLGPELATQGLQRLQTLPALHRSVHSNASERLAVSALEMSWYMRNQLLRDADWAGMAQSLEIRVPFVDITLLRACAPVFAAFPDISKPELAALAAPKLSHKVLNRPKTGFSVPVREWMRADATHKDGRGLRDWAQFIHRRYAGARA
ncbi:MAG: asparagine synthase (glutamine-hydrolyzing) [Pseudomonadota bacterium]|nr:asparagine synthase (glutamine-hydrolyzing) [Pseudomonadota bacterium]